MLASSATFPGQWATTSSGGRTAAASEPASAGSRPSRSVTALIARDRAGHTAGAALPDLGSEAIAAALGPVIAQGCSVL